MKPFARKLVSLVLAFATLFAAAALSSCGSDDKVITVCASDVPHAEVLMGVVKDILKEKGYTLNVTILDWQEQNGAVAAGDYDANYFQHVPYLESDSSAKDLFAVCKVHYEPLGIYYGKATKGSSILDAKSFAICNDASNAIRAFQLLEAKGVTVAGDGLPYNADTGELNFTTDTWTTTDGVKITLIAENLLVSSMADYDFALLPCNTAYTGNVDSSKRAAVEDDPAQVALKANVIAACKATYDTDAAYKAKIDALADAMLSKEVSDYFKTKYLGAMTCDSSSQIDLRK